MAGTQKKRCRRSCLTHRIWPVDSYFPYLSKIFYGNILVPETLFQRARVDYLLRALITKIKAYCMRFPTVLTRTGGLKYVC